MLEPRAFSLASAVVQWRWWVIAGWAALAALVFGAVRARNRA